MALSTKFLYGEEENLPSKITNGWVYFLIDAGRIYFDIEGSRIKLYDSDLAEVKRIGTAAQSEIADLKSTVGTVATGTTIVEMIKALEAEVLGETTDENSKTLNQRVTEAEDALTILNADSQTEGSVKKTVAEAISAIVAGADESLDTLKEIADWITSHATDAAQMSNDIERLKGSDTVEGSVANSIKNAIDDLDVSDTPVEGQYIESVSQVDGKIVVSRKPFSDLEGLQWGTFTSIAETE